MSVTLSSDNTVLLNKRELARLLGVSVVTVNAYIDRYPGLPVVQAGTNGKEWQFDAAAVKAFMAEKEAEEERQEAEREQQIAQLGLGLEDSAKAGEAKFTPAERVAYARALKMEDEIAQSRGFLVQTGRVRSEFSNRVERWNKTLYATLRQAGRDLNLPDAVTRALEDRLATAQSRFINDLIIDAGITENAQRSFA